jgi:hypothetical protein
MRTLSMKKCLVTVLIALSLALIATLIADNAVPALAVREGDTLWGLIFPGQWLHIP